MNLPSRSPNRAPMERDAHFQILVLHITQSPGGVESPEETKSHLVKVLPYMFPQQSPCGEMLHLQSQWFTYPSILSPHLRSFCTKWVENMQSPSTDPHMFRRPLTMGCGLVPQGD